MDDKSSDTLMKVNKMVVLNYSICLFCGSRTGGNPAYGTVAEEVGRSVAEEGWRLVYGAGDLGLMGKAARSAKRNGGTVFGVIPSHLIEHEIARFDLDSVVVTENMHERKKVMFMNSDAIVTMPGGPGTLDEFFEVVTWRQLGLHTKPIILLNVGGYWDRLLRLVDGIIEEGFAGESFRNHFSVQESVAALIDELRKARRRESAE